ncbi:MAG: hypothetical protein AAB501_01170 [Patescibacteria group bacterium]
MIQSNFGELKNLVDNIKNLKNISDFSSIMYKISAAFNRDSRREIQNIIENNFHINPIFHIFNNENFQKATYRVLTSEQELLEDKKLINLGLKLSTFILSYVLSDINEYSIPYLKEKLNRGMGSIKYYTKNQGTESTRYDISHILLESLNSKYDHWEKYTGGIFDFNAYIKGFRLSRCLITGMIFSLKHETFLKRIFKDFFKDQKEMDRFNLSFALNNIHQKVKMLDILEESIEDGDDKKCFANFMEAFNDNKNSKFAAQIIKIMTDGFQKKIDSTGIEAMIEKINKAEQTSKDLNKLANDSLQAFSGELQNTNIEWSNKIYLISKKTLGALDSLVKAKDNKWISDVFNYEFYNWANDVHAVINKYDIEDDWEKIENLVKQENSKVEWKSSFYTSTERLFIDDRTEESFSRDILDKVVNVMLGMMNSGGGTVLVGLVENPESIIREDVKKRLVVKKNITFFDINYELNKKNKNLDDLKREIQDKLFGHTMQTTEKFNDLWNIEPIEIKNDDTMVTIYKITVQNSLEYIFNTKKEKEGLWITLTHRADGRTLKVDPREYINKKKPVS